MISLIDYGFNNDMIPERASGIPARITAVHKERYELVCEHGQVFGRLKTSVYYASCDEAFPTTGDFVMIDYVSNGDSRIIKTLKAKSYFSRLDPSSSGHGEQPIAANFNYVFIVASLNNDFNIKRIERYLTLAWQSGAMPVIILTKADLVEDYTEQVLELNEVSVGVGVHAVSAKTGYGLSELAQYLKPQKTIVFLGSSGVGKSSLVNALANEDIMTVNGIREDDSKGRHTTTHRQLIMLDSGVMIIDTPGMRELGMWDVSDGLGKSFTDVEEFLGQCKFSDCRHQAEPGCAVKKAIEDGVISLERWNSYLHLKNEAKYADDKVGYLRERSQMGKSNSKHQKRSRKY